MLPFRPASRLCLELVLGKQTPPIRIEHAGGLTRLYLAEQQGRDRHTQERGLGCNWMARAWSLTRLRSRALSTRRSEPKDSWGSRILM